MRARRIAKWAGFAVAVILAVLIVAVTVVYMMIGRDFDQRFVIQRIEADVPTDAASMKEGERLARLRGCLGGCHGKATEGALFVEFPDGSAIVAPDLGRAVRKYSTAELEGIIRQGVRPDGRSVIVAMPSEMLHYLSDADLGRILAYLGTRSPGNEELPDGRQFGVVGRLMLLYYKQLLGTLLAAEFVDRGIPRPDIVHDDPLARGRYLALTICSECHGLDLRGMEAVSAPTLAIAAAYSLENFRRLLRTGEPIGRRKLELMADVSKGRFVYFREDEIDALHTYLTTLATSAEPVPGRRR